MKLGIILLLGCLAPWSRADWPDFRGPGCDGRAGPAGGTNRIGLPLRWSETENVKWKTPIPYRGWSTPVILGGQIWLTTATLDGHDFFAVCADAGAGTIIFDERVFHCDDPEPLGNDVNCYASPSPVVEPAGPMSTSAVTARPVWTRPRLKFCGGGTICPAVIFAAPAPRRSCAATC